MTSAHDFATATRPATPSAAAQEPAPALPPGLDRNTLDALTHGRLGDPFAVLGPHRLETAEGRGRTGWCAPSIPARGACRPSTRAARS